MKPKQKPKHSPLIRVSLEKGPDTKTFMNIDDFREFLIQNEVSRIDAREISKRMSYSAKIRTIFHTFKMSVNEIKRGPWCGIGPMPKPMSLRSASRTSVIIKANKQGSNIVATVSVINGINSEFISNTFLSARDLEEINKLIDDETRPLIKKYFE